MNGITTDIDIDRIILKDTPREQSTDLATLQMSINSVGLLSPIVIDRDDVLISGSRRLQACKNLDIEKISAIKFDIEYTSMTALNIQSDENLCREPLSAEELERLIAKKQSAASGSAGKSIKTGFMGALKRLFGAA